VTAAARGNRPGNIAAYQWQQGLNETQHRDGLAGVESYLDYKPRTFGLPAARVIQEPAHCLTTHAVEGYHNLSGACDCIVSTEEIDDFVRLRVGYNSSIFIDVKRPAVIRDDANCM